MPVATGTTDLRQQPYGLMLNSCSNLKLLAMKTNFSLRITSRRISGTVIILSLLLFLCTPHNLFAAEKNNLPDGIIYRVAGDAKNISKSENLAQTFAPISNEFYITEYGAYKTFSAAEIAKKELTAKGLSNAEITAYSNQKKINLSDALNLTDDNGDQFQSSGKISIADMDKLMKMMASMEYHYTITFPDQGLSISEIESLDGKIEMRSNGKGEQVISFGKFNSYESAKTYVVLLRQLGIENANVCAWNGSEEEISIEQAYNFELSANGE